MYTRTFCYCRVCPILERCSLNKYSVYKKCELLVSFAAKGLKKSVYLAKNSMGILQDVGRVEKGHSQGVIGVCGFFFFLFLYLVLKPELVPSYLFWRGEESMASSVNTVSLFQMRMILTCLQNISL